LKLEDIFSDGRFDKRRSKNEFTKEDWQQYIDIFG
jgi:hypothetical protein